MASVFAIHPTVPTPTFSGDCDVWRSPRVPAIGVQSGQRGGVRAIVGWGAARGFVSGTTWFGPFALAYAALNAPGTGAYRGVGNPAMTTNQGRLAPRSVARSYGPLYRIPAHPSSLCWDS
jgi:hypothetical protein